MSLAELGGLVALALVDSTSFGTLLIPLWMLLAPRVRPGRVLLFLGTVVVFYYVVGVALLLGIGAVAGDAADLADAITRHRPFLVAQAAVGVALFAWSYRIENKAKASGGESPRARRWRGVLQGETTARTTIVVALTATVLEVATMLPYLAATGLITRSDLDRPAQLGVLAGYVVVMVLPALVALLLRLCAARLVEPWLRRLGDWLSARSGVMVAWTVGIVGFFVALDAIGRLTT